MEQRKGKQGPFRLYLYSIIFLAIALVSFSLCLSYILPAYVFGIHSKVLEILNEDHHYKYLVPLLIPTTAWFAIANWVGWEYFRFA